MIAEYNMKPFDWLIWAIFVGLIGLLILGFVSGCGMFESSQHIKTDPVVEDTTTSILEKVVYKQNWLVTVSIVGLAASFFAFLNGSKMGLAAMASCAVALFMTLATIEFGWWMALFGGIASLATVGASVLTKDTAIKDMITNIQDLKVWSSDRPAEEILDKQSKSTKRLVLEKKAKMKSKGQL